MSKIKYLESIKTLPCKQCIVILLTILFKLNLFASTKRIHCKTIASTAPHQLRSEFDNSAQYQNAYTRVISRLEDHKMQLAWHSFYQAGWNQNKAVKIIDAGGNAGLGRNQLKHDSPKRQVEIFDLSKDALNEARRNGVKKSDTHQSNIISLRRNSGKSRVAARSIDGVMTSNVLYMLSKKELIKFFQEANRVLVNEGTLSISTMKKASKEQANNFLHALKAEVKNLEESGQVKEGDANTFFEANTKLMKRSPTPHNPHIVLELAREMGFKLIPNSYGEFYLGNAYFMALKKVSEPNHDLTRAMELLKEL